jgi:hypothetical protein
VLYKWEQGEQQAHALLEERVLELQKWRAEAHTLAQRLLEEERRTADARYSDYIIALCCCTGTRYCYTSTMTSAHHAHPAVGTVW